MKELASVVDKEKLVNVVANHEFLYNRDDKKLQEQEVSVAWCEIANNMEYLVYKLTGL